MKKQIRIHVQRFSWDKRGAIHKLSDKRMCNLDELKALNNFDELPPVGSLIEVLIDVDLNVWFQCSGYDGRAGLYLKEWDGKKGNVKDIL